MDIGTGIVVATGIIVAGGLTAFMFYRSAKEGKEIVKKPFETAEKGIEETGRTIRDGIKESGKTARDIFVPIADAIALKIKTSSDELNRLRTESVNLKLEIDRLKSQRIDVLSVKSILMLALAEIQCSFNDFKRIILKDTPRKLLERREQFEYIGVAHVNYKIRIGIDLEKLKFKLRSNNDNDKTIWVSGLRKIEIIGLKDIKPEWKLREVRRHLTEGNLKPVAHEIIEYDTSEEVTKQINEILEKLEGNPLLSQMEDAMERIALGTLNTFSGKSGYEFKSDDNKGASGISIKDIFDEINKKVEVHIEDKEKQIKQIDNSICKIEANAIIFTDKDKAEILTLAEKNK